MMDAVKEHAPALGVAPLCETLGLSRATVYRAWHGEQFPVEPKPRPKPARALSDDERQEVLDLLHEDRFVDQPPAQVYATLLDEERFFCSERTMYVILDIFSRYAVGWMAAPRESATLARQLISETCRKQEIAEEQLTLHADRGSSMRSKMVAMLLSDLGVTKTHSRPHVSNDNPFSERQFKTLKYRLSCYPESAGRNGGSACWRAACRGIPRRGSSKRCALGQDAQLTSRPNPKSSSD